MTNKDVADDVVNSDTSFDYVPSPDNFVTSEDEAVGVTYSGANDMNDPERDDVMVSQGMHTEVDICGAHDDNYPAQDDVVTNENMAVDTMDTQAGNFVATDDLLKSIDVPMERNNYISDDGRLKHPAKRARTEAPVQYPATGK